MSALLFASQVTRNGAMRNLGRFNAYCPRIFPQPCNSRRKLATKAVLRPNIAVVGGGHAGISVALRLASMPWTRLTRPRITLIDRSDRFCFLPMTYELALGQVSQWEIAPKFNDLLYDSPVQFLHGNVENLDLTSGAAEGTRCNSDRAEEFRIPFDRAIIAVGAEPAYIDSTLGAKEFAIPFYTMKDAIKLRNKLSALRKIKTTGEIINVVVVGGGFSGVELASCLGEDLGATGSVTVVESSDSVLKNSSDFNRSASLRALSSNGISIECNSRVTEVTQDSVVVQKRTEDDTNEITFPADLVLWTAGSRASSALSSFGLPLDDLGRVLTDDYLQVKSQEDVLYSIGDGAAAIAEGGYFGTAQVAVQQAEYAAWNTWASLTDGRPKLPNKYLHLGEMMVLGAANATVTTSVGLELDGRPAWIARRLAYLARMPTDRHRARVAASWAANPLLQGLGNLVEASQKYASTVRT